MSETLSLPRNYKNLAKFIQNQRSLGFKDFKVNSVLGKGSFGMVFNVSFIKANFKHSFALKVIRKNEIQNQKRYESIVNEICILSAMNHPMIVQIIASFIDNLYIYMLFEYVEGGELADRFSKIQNFDE